MMKKNWFLFCIILFSSYAFCFAQSQERYDCNDGYFSFIPPENWKALEIKDLRKKFGDRLFRYEISRDFSPANGELVAACEPLKDSSSEFDLIFVYKTYLYDESEIELENRWLSSEKKIEDYWLSERKRQKKMQQYYSNNPVYTPAEIKIEDAKYSYRQHTHMAFEETKGKMNDLDFIRVTAVILGSRTKTTVVYQSSSKTIADVRKLVRQITGSFKYHPSYEFGVPNPQRMDAQMHERMWLLTRFCVFSIVMAVGLLLFRIISGVRIPIISIAVAAVSGGLVRQVCERLVWNEEAMSIRMYLLPLILAMIVMVTIIWKWPGSEISLAKSFVGVGSLVFLLSLEFYIIMGVASGLCGTLPILVLLVFIMIIWKAANLED